MMHEHNWIDASQLGSSLELRLCIKCGAQETRLRKLNPKDPEPEWQLAGTPHWDTKK